MCYKDMKSMLFVVSRYVLCFLDFGPIYMLVESFLYRKNGPKNVNKIVWVEQATQPFMVVQMIKP